MFTFQIIIMALLGLRANLLRSLLATLGVIIGVGAVISAMSILEGTQRDIIDRFESLGSETIFVRPEFAKRGGRPIGLVQTMTMEDVEGLSDARRCPHIAAVAPQVAASLSLKYFSKNKQVDVLGTNHQFAEMFNYKVAKDPEGKKARFLTREEVASEQKVAVLGSKVASELFGQVSPIDKGIRLKGISFRIIGVMEEKGNVGMNAVDTQVFVPVTTAMRRLLGVKYLQGMLVQARGAENVDAAIAEIKRELRRRHDIRFRSGQKDDFEIISQEEQRKQVDEVIWIFQIVLYSIAGISLVVGGIGIMNIMLVSVTERTREIGVRMAVGAQRRDILRQFLIESSVISFLGGAFGVGLSYVMTDLLESVTQIIETYTSSGAIGWALSMAIMTGVFSGLYPAYKASRLDPVEALRYE